MILGFPPIKCINEKDLNFLTKQLIQNNFIIYQINGENIYDSDTFYQESIKVIPQDPPLIIGGPTNFDAFVDSLWGGIAELKTDNVAILWTKTNRILDDSLNDLVMIIQCLYDIARTLNSDYGLERTVNLLIFLVGSGESFVLYDKKI